MPDLRGRFRELVASASASVGSSVATGASPGQAVAAGAITLVQDLYLADVQHNERAAVVTLELAARDLGMSLPEVAQRVKADPRLLKLVTAALRAAEDSVSEAKMLYLATLLADGIRDLSAADIARAHVDALADLHAPHLRIMALLPTPPPTADPPDEHGRHRKSWEREDIIMSIPETRLVLPSLLATLERCGIAYNQSTGAWGGGYEEAGYLLTDFGIGVLADLRDASEAVASR